MLAQRSPSEERINMSVIRFFILASIAATGIGAGATTDTENFDTYFSDSTLRIDYVFGGGPKGIQLQQRSQSKSVGWAGRRRRLEQTPLAGNGEIQVIDSASGRVLYRNPFSTLFHEWLDTDEAKTEQRGFENSFLVPLPRADADIKIVLRNNRHEEIGSAITHYSPSDELVRQARKKPLAHTYLHRGASADNAIDIALLAEGYTAEEMDSFICHARKSVDEILKYEPFASYKDKLNFVAVMSPSSESGVSVPANGEWKDTAFGAHFGTFHSPRYLTVPNVWRLYDALEGIPFEHIMVIVNTDKYGGGGIFNAYHIAAARNKHTLPVTVHEFGHSFAGLADEYFYEGAEEEMYPDGIEPWEPNITTLTDFGAKWADMIKPSTPIPTPWVYDGGKRDDIMKRQNENSPATTTAEEVGVYEGAGYRLHGVYRPAITCRMRDNYHPSFCPVCRRAIARIMDFYLP